MKKLFTFLLVLSLVFSPVWSLGSREKGLKTIFFGDKSTSQQTLSSEKQIVPSSVQNESQESSQKSTILQESSNIAEMTTDEIVDEIISKTDSVDKINTETLKSLVVVKATNDMLETQLADAETYTDNLEEDYNAVSADLINSNLKIEGLNGEVDTLKEKVKNNKSFSFALLGVNYNKALGYGATFDIGTKFASGLITSVGVSAPATAFNPVDALDINSYTFNTKIGWAW